MSPFGDFIGIEIETYAEGHARCSLKLAPHHMNNGGRVHGGVLTALADTTAGMAVRSVRPTGTQTATTDLSIAFIRPPAGELLIAEAKVIHAGKRLLRTEISVSCENKLVARTYATFMIVSTTQA